MLGRKGPKTSSPGRYIRHIYNRIILENATVRAAAVTSLAKFGAQVLLRVLLGCCLCAVASSAPRCSCTLNPRSEIINS